jgi:hypothetical protein
MSASGVVRMRRFDVDTYFLTVAFFATIVFVIILINGAYGYVDQGFGSEKLFSLVVLLGGGITLLIAWWGYKRFGGR